MASHDHLYQDDSQPVLHIPPLPDPNIIKRMAHHSKRTILGRIHFFAINGVGVITTERRVEVLKKWWAVKDYSGHHALHPSEAVYASLRRSNSLPAN
jgi:hypothetical protein